MAFWSAWRVESGQRDQLSDWRVAGALDDQAWQRAQSLAGRWPSAQAWRGFLEHLSLWLAVALLAAALICFIAANWDQLGRFARLYGAQLALVIVVALAWRFRLDRPAGQAALLLAGVLLGGVLALIGQTYQTGADTWQLFALWAALLVPWTLAGASMPMGLLWATVANTALWLYLAEITREPIMPWATSGLFNLGLFIAWSVLANRMTALRGGTGPRLLAAAALAASSIAALLAIIDSPARTSAGLLVWFLVIAAIGLCAWRWRRDLVILALVALSIIVVDTCLAARALFEVGGIETGAMLILALLVIGQASAASMLLRRLASSGGQP
jgi:uncharacterized membrane protein